MCVEHTPESPIADRARLAAHLASERGPPHATAESPSAVDYRPSDETWAYQFEIAPAWRRLAAGADTPVETTYPGWGTVRIQPASSVVFSGSALTGSTTDSGGRIGSSATIAQEDTATEREDGMLAVFRAERNRLVRASDDHDRAAGYV